MSMRKQKQLTRSIHMFLIAGAVAAFMAPPVYAVPANTQLPTDGKFLYGGNSTNITQNNNTMNISQNKANAVIKWDNFSIGSDATVNFTGTDNNKSAFNTLNYVNSGKVSEIYGQMNAANGNIYVVNTAGVQIGASAQINVGSLYVSNKDLGIDDKTEWNKNNLNFNNLLANGKTTNAELMSLGGIVTPGNVTFDGDRIVIDTDHLYTNTNGTPMNTDSNLIIKTTDADNVVLGYTAFDSANNTYANADEKLFTVSENGQKKTVNGYMWVENLLQLQAMETKLNGYYALRNSIDANYSADSNYYYPVNAADDKKGFASIGDSNTAFTGRFDGLGYDIFDLNIKRADEKYVGLFGYAEGAVIRNFTLNSGSVTGGSNTGAAVGKAVKSTVENIINTADVNGNSTDGGTGGIVGTADVTVISGLINTGTINGVNNVGGIVGNITGGSIGGETYNLGAVTGTGQNVGGIAGTASSTTIGNDEDAFTIYNQLNVTGGYNVGGIAGNINNTTVQNVTNTGTVLATGSKVDYYSYHTANTETKVDGENNITALPVNQKISGTTLNGNIATIEVKAANAGGIAGNAAGSKISNATNEGDVTTTTTTSNNTAVGTYYNAGNVGGIVGRAEDTNITNVENKENTVAGAHNVGGAVGYLTGKSTVSGAINNGGDITATGARRNDGNNSINNGFAQESVRDNAQEIFNIGNMGGIVGYMYGDETYIKDSSNRGTVHSAYITDQDYVLDISEAANAGGVVGKIDRSNTKQLSDNKIVNGDGTEAQAAVSGSYNTGDVQGYTGVGGVAGFMYNGEVTAAYNLGKISATRKAQPETIQPLNMGGVVGDSTEGTDASILVYDVYNAGQIGDETYNLYGRHVGGVVGRLSGKIEKAYNTGDIYNGFNVVGGVVGYWYKGTINNTFNTGNITVVNNNNAQSQVGGIVGAADISTSVGNNAMKLSNSYNLGTLRSFRNYYDREKPDDSRNAVGGIVGYVVNWNGTQNANLTIDGVYTLGNLYAANLKGNVGSTGDSEIGAVVGLTDKSRFSIGDSGAFYITPESNSFATVITAGTTNDNGVHSIAFVDRYKKEKYGKYENNVKTYTGLIFSTQTGGLVEDDTDNNWRIYDAVYDENGNLIGGTTPILNAFLPDVEDYFSSNMEGINSIQYGTAYNPLLTIIHANQNQNLTYDWKDLAISGAAGLAVYGGGLTLNNFASLGDNRYFGGTIYSDGALTINGSGSNYNLGAASNLYGSSVTLNAGNGDATIYGNVTSTNGDIRIDGDNVEIIGTLNAKGKGDTTTIVGIDKSPDPIDTTDLNDPNKKLESIADRFSYETNGADNNGNITVSADGTAEILYGHLGTGSVSTDGTFSVEGTNGVYVDTDLLDVKGKIELKSANGEALLDITNTANAHITGTDTTGKNALHQFLKDHNKEAAGITINGANDKEKITIDMWDGSNEFDLDKYDENVKLVNALNGLYINGQSGNNADYTYIWISNAEQLKGIQEYKVANSDSGILGYNFALKNDIDASKISNYKAIASGNGEVYTGTFDGRGNRIIGLTVGEKDSVNGGDTDNTPSSAGIFGTVGKVGKVEDLRVYASNFYGKDYAGAVAGSNNGTITGITTLGNHVEAFGSSNSMELFINENGSQVSKHVGAAGGIAGYNTGDIKDVTASDSVIAGYADGSDSTGNLLATAGGIAGVNDGKIQNVTADSAITANQDTTYSLGGIAGVNRTGAIDSAYNTGVTHGEYGDGNITSNSVGGIAGVNTGSISNVYNGADITGGKYVGGVVGYNHKLTNSYNSGEITNAVNAGDILADFTYTDDQGQQHYYEYTGGLAGYNAGTISGGRNTSEIYGGNYVGGMVGGNAAGAELTNLSNSVFASITGESYVGGIAGQNYGSINATDSAINNYGKVYGQHYVGGIAGANENGGTIANTISSITLHVKNPNESDKATYFGGVVGQNSGTINGATNKSSVDVAAEGATYVGGIIGQNTSTGTLEGKIRNGGTVSGLSNVGGIIGENINQSILNNENKPRLTISNKGNVSATDGGAAGIFYNNKGIIKNVDLVNEGTVTGGKDPYSVTGGLFGINTGDITDSTLTNTGTVTGRGTVGGLIGNNSGSASGSVFTNDGTVEGEYKVGGLFGINSGSFNTSSLINTVNAQVAGMQNVGGLIGVNTGNIEGGRNEQEVDKDGKETVAADSYYKYQIYNNGTITANGNGSNIGGLIGNNTTENGKTGSLTAGYNTGAINASGSTNVGGIAGSNSGTIDQVFNTVYNTDGTKGAITGGTNVGGLVGTNSGTLSNAYNTTDVFGNSVFGNAVGNNTAKGTIKNIYASNNSGKLIGENINQSADAIQKAYSFVNGDTSATKIISGEDQKDSGSYAGFDFANGTWKNYDENGNPLLKVFLTDVTINVDVDKINKYINNVYNGDAQYITDEDIDKLIAEGAITAPDNFTAYKNAKELINSISHTNAGTYNDWLYSGQIASSGTGETFNPNNLGYDIVLTADIDKATINISLDDIYRTYGDIDNIYSDADRTTGTTYDGSYTIDTSNLNDVLLEYIKNNLSVTLNSDGSLAGDGKTQNVGDYDWSLKVTLGGNNASNYQINSSDSASNVVVTGEKKAHVEKANLTINLDEVIRNYGSTLITNNGGDYSATISGLVNGDDELGYTSDDLDITVTGDEALTGSNTGRVTNNAGDYTWSATVTGVDNSNLTNLSDNYNITVNGTGKSTVKKVQLTVDLDEVTRTYGNTVITNNNGEYSISNIQGLVNGDADLGYDVDDLVINVTSDTALTGNSTGEVTKDANGDYTWSATVSGKDGDLTNLSTNYEIVTTGTGKSTVNKADLIININDVETTYGTAFDESKYSYGFGNNGANGLVNGDVLDDVKDAIDSATGGYENTGAADGINGKITQDAKDGYSLSFNNELTNTNTLKNYNIITVNNGDSTVNKKQITIGANDEQILVGETPNYSGTDIDSVLVNGDSLNGNYHYGVADGTVESVTGTHTGVIGVWIGGVFYDLSQNVDWAQAGSFFSNYEVNSTPGTLTVSAYDIPEDWPHNRWDYLFNDAPFDRNKDFRERKAEVNFVDGAMEI